MGKYDELAKKARNPYGGKPNLLKETAVADKTDITGDAALKRKGLYRNSPGVAYKATTPGPALVAGGALGAVLAVPGVSQLALTAASGMLGDRIARDVAGGDKVDQFYDEYAMPLMVAAPALQPALQAAANYASAVRNMLGAKMATGAQSIANSKYLKNVEHNIKIRTTPADINLPGNINLSRDGVRAGDTFKYLPDNAYRLVGQNAIDDLFNTGIVRGTPKYEGRPYFNVGNSSSRYLQKAARGGGPYMIEARFDPGSWRPGTAYTFPNTNEQLTRDMVNLYRLNDNKWMLIGNRNIPGGRTMTRLDDVINPLLIALKNSVK